jgi:hypothetical protein
MDAVKVHMSRPSPGVAPDWTSMSNTQVSKAPDRGLSSSADAIIVLRERVETAITYLEVNTLTALMASLASKNTKVKKEASNISGKYTFIASESSHIIYDYSSLNTVSLSVDGSGPSNSGLAAEKRLTSTLHHPATAVDFCFLIFVWTMLLVATSLDHYFSVVGFVITHVFDT